MPPHFLLPFLFFFFCPSSPTFAKHRCSLFHGLGLKRCGSWGPSSLCLFLRTLLILKTQAWCLVQAQAWGRQWPDPCHVNPHWIAWDSNLSSSRNYKVSTVSQPVMTRSKAIAGPLMYFGSCPLLYLARLWESTIQLLAIGLCQNVLWMYHFTPHFSLFPSVMAPCLCFSLTSFHPLKEKLFI